MYFITYFFLSLKLLASKRSFHFSELFYYIPTNSKQKILTYLLLLFLFNIKKSDHQFLYRSTNQQIKPANHIRTNNVLRVEYIYVQFQIYFFFKWKNIYDLWVLFFIYLSIYLAIMWLVVVWHIIFTYSINESNFFPLQIFFL